MGSGSGSVDASFDLPKMGLRKLLVANRGEIAIRVTRAARELGIRTVAIYSPPDRLMPHRFKADESYEVGTEGMTPVQCYLDIEGIIKLCKEHGVDAVHPGYGFLSENAEFARRCQDEGITFVGPSHETITRMGDKTAARTAAQQAGVPVVPGTDEALADADSALVFAERAGYPVILKAAMGGGGRGMRVVRSSEEMRDAFVRASNEATKAFGDGRMFIEKFVDAPRHIEVQVLADGVGNTVHLSGRDCSVQRRHQKVVEIAPAPGLDPAVRTRLLDAAIKIAQHVGYRNAGTVEFMVDRNGDFYFLEVNPRIQVEHTITEEVTGIDLVQSQLMIAGGATLPSIGLASQSDVAVPASYAIQCRITSEDAEKNFQPEVGRIEAYRTPGGPGIRLDGWLTTGNTISPHYDSLLVKVITRAPTYEAAVRKMSRAIDEFAVRGVKTNIPFLRNVFRNPEFSTGPVTTKFIEDNPDLLVFRTDAEGPSKVLNYLAEMAVNGPSHPGQKGPRPKAMEPEPPVAPKGAVPRGWRDILVKDGPEGWAKQVREHKGVLITDTTWRDAHQSLLATRMRTVDLVRAAPATAHYLGAAGSIEMWGGATFDVSLRFLKECPWARLEKLRELVPNVPFQMLLRGANAVGYTTYADNVVDAFTLESVRTGMDVFRVFDSLNYIDNLKFGIDSVRRAGGVAEGTLCYTGDVLDPKQKIYTLEYYLELAREIVNHGAHSIAVKDMAGLLKPRAATLLIGALRAEFPDIPIHVHTHDTAGTGVATQLAAANAGADIIDCAIDSMSGTTSQPSMGAIVNSLAGTNLDTGIDPTGIVILADYWEKTRALYGQFEATDSLKSSSADVYLHEMPGGQYTNLKFQAESLGLGSQWDAVKLAYAQANRALGDIVKVTPSSKVVGDLAQFMVQNDLDELTVVERAEELSFPGSVVEFMQGLIGQPPRGFPEPFRTRVLKGAPVTDGRPGESLPPVNLLELQGRLEETHGVGRVSDRDVLSAALYPQVYEEYRAHLSRFGGQVAKLPSTSFWNALQDDEHVILRLPGGQTADVKYKARGEVQPSGKREVFFEVNGVPRVVEVQDRNVGGEGTSTAKKVGREKVTPGKAGSVGAPMSGEVIEILTEPGVVVKAGQALAVLSAMKMETTVAAPVAGLVRHVAVVRGDAVDAADLLFSIEEGKMTAD